MSSVKIVERERQKRGSLDRDRRCVRSAFELRHPHSPLLPDACRRGRTYHDPRAVENLHRPPAHVGPGRNPCRGIGPRADRRFLPSGTSIATSTMLAANYGECDSYPTSVAGRSPQSSAGDYLRRGKSEQPPRFEGAARRFDADSPHHRRARDLRPRQRRVRGTSSSRRVHDHRQRARFRGHGGRTQRRDTAGLEHLASGGVPDESWMYGQSQYR